MQPVDAVAAGLVVASAVAMALGSASLARAADLGAAFWLGLGTLALGAGVRLVGKNR
jgi:hypothetical protein